MSSPAFEVALARLYTDTSFREQFLRDPQAVLVHIGLTAAEQADLAAIDRAGLLMAAASYCAKRSRHPARRGRIIRRVRQYLARWPATDTRTG
jgi:hypothetical protein